MLCLVDSLVVLVVSLCVSMFEYFVGNLHKIGIFVHRNILCFDV